MFLEINELKRRFIHLHILFKSVNKSNVCLSFIKLKLNHFSSLNNPTIMSPYDPLIPSSTIHFNNTVAQPS